MKAEKIIQKATEDGRIWLTEAEAKSICEDYGISISPFKIAKDKSEAVEHANGIGYPVVLKIYSHDILHKSDVGGVILNIGDDDELLTAYDQILKNVKIHSPDADIQGMLVQKMTPYSTEVIIGMVRDVQFGATIMFGLGGVFVEILEDVSFRVTPLDEIEARKMIEEIRGYPLLSGARGREKLDVKSLIHAIMKVSELALKHPEIDQLDLNPIFVYKKGYSAADARIKLNGKELEEAVVSPEFVTRTINQLDNFFNARSVAVVGASPKSRIASGALKALINGGYQGRIYPVNLRYEEIFGLKCYSSLLDIPDRVDLAVFVLPASIIPKIMEECASKGIKNVVIVSASFKEVGGRYAELQEEVVRIAKENDIRIIGPNCIGVFNPKNKLDTLFQFYERMIRPEPGHLAFLSQSGTFVVTLLERAAEEGVGISKIVSYGNRADVDEADIITYLGEDPDTKVISIYIEGVGDGRKLMEAANRVVMKKPIIVCKGGKTEKSSQAAVSHTGNLAGSYSILESAFKQSGIILADNMEDLYVTCKALITQPLPKGKNVAMVTNGMGTSVMAIDAIARRKLELASYSENTKAVLKKRLLPFMSQGNPVDLTASATAEDYKIVIETLLQDSQVDIVIPFLIFQDNPLDDKIIDSIGDLSKRYDKPILCWASGGPYTKTRINKIESLGIPVYSTPEATITASYGLVMYHEIKQKKGKKRLILDQ